MKQRSRLGSPPRMRGKLLMSFLPVSENGITPADAGKTNVRMHRGNVRTDHPRGCGENLRVRAGSIRPRGSPPRMRGKQSATFLCASVRRITPADAGKTDLRFANLEGAEDHPRGCGENRILAACSGGCSGSPPRMRGKQICPVIHQKPPRITPADAGKTHSNSFTNTKPWDHPRGCGENSLANRAESVEAGSPPRMRGKLLLMSRLAALVRITPADAGKTE